LIVVDVQNGFINRNLPLFKSSAGQDGAEVIPIINYLIRTIPFDAIVYTHDWHPRNHISFFENLESRRHFLKDNQNRTIKMFDEITYTGPKVEMKQVLWPTHCIQETDDAALHKNLDIISATDRVVHIKKGLDSDIDSYSAFAVNNGAQKTELHDKLKERSVTQVFVTG
jgi:nicotinamidase-related amidase